MAGKATGFGNAAISDLLTSTLLEERGRKRRRTSDDVAAQLGAHNLSSESRTLRGRGRRRSASGLSTQSAGTSNPHIRGLSSPARKYQKKALLVDPVHKKRSQSPSRSRSKDRDGTPCRRRQRTTSRSRRHGAEKGGEQRPNQEESIQKKKSETTT